MTEGEGQALLGLMPMVETGFDRDRFAYLLNQGPGAVSDLVWSKLVEAEQGRHLRTLEERENLAILMIEVDLARRLVVARMGTDQAISNTFEAHRSAAIHAMERGNALEASGPEAVLWFQAASIFFEKTGEPLFQADALFALAGCLHETLQGDVAANLVQAEEILAFARTRILSASPRSDGHGLPAAALERLGWIAYRRALFASRQARFVGPDPQRVLDLLLEAADWSVSCEDAGELHDEIRGLALHQGVLPQVELALAAGAASGDGGDAEQMLQHDLQRALAADQLPRSHFGMLLEQLDRFIALGACGPLSVAELHILKAQLIIAHDDRGDEGDRCVAALPDLDSALERALSETRRGRVARLAALRLRATSRARSGSHEAALYDLAMLVAESEQAARAAQTSAGSRGSVEHLRSLSGFAARIGVMAGHPERGLCIADACRAVGLRALLADADSADPPLDHVDLVHGVSDGAAAVSLIPTGEGLVVFVTLPGRTSYRDGETLGLIADGTSAAIDDLSRRWSEVYRAMLETLERRHAIDPEAWSSASDALSGILEELAHAVALPLARRHREGRARELGPGHLALLHHR